MVLLRQQIILVLCLITLVYISYSLVAQFILPSSYRHQRVEPSPISHILDSSANATQILLVSAFFPLTDTKHTQEEYTTWLSMFLPHVKTHVYFYTPPELEAVVKELRGALPITIDTSFSSPFDVPPLRGLQNEYESMNGHQERTRHRFSAELYATWNAKPYLLHRAVNDLKQRDGKEYEYAFWNDAGSFRDGQMSAKVGEWPDSGRVKDIWTKGSEMTGSPKEDLILLPMWGPPHASMRFWNEMLGPIDSSFTQGTFFGGSPKAISWLSQAFYAYHDFYLFRVMTFVGNDQRTLNSLSLLFPERFITVWQNDPEAPNYTRSNDAPLGKCGHPWIYYQFFVAGAEDMNTMREFWKSKISWPWRWLKNAQDCKVARLLTMESVLKRRFGNDWVSPRPSIDINASYRP